MLKSFKSKALRQFAEKGDASKLSVANRDRVAIVLRALDAASRSEDMNIPGLFFHALKGKEKGRYSVRVTGNWRITFGWDGQDVVDVDIEDYH